MPTKPTVGGDYKSWGTKLNTFLDVSHDSGGKIKDGALQTTSAAPTSDAMVANKKYVDDTVDAVGSYTPSTYAGEESVTFPNGMIVKCGATSCSGDGDTTVTFDTAFPTACSYAMACQGGSFGVTDDAGAGCHTLAAASMKLRNGVANTQTIRWIAIGY